MNTVFCSSLSVRLFFAASAAALLLAPGAVRAQTLFGTGGATNTAISVPNLAFGYHSLVSNTTGYYNTAMGYNALYANTAGYSNTAIGYNSLASNATGYYNAADGYNSMVYNTTGSWNTAHGVSALLFNTTGYYNTAHGSGALAYNTSGSENTADGYGALYNNSTGSYNIALGYSSGSNLTTGSFNIAIGNLGVAAETGAIRIGTTGYHKSTYIAGINGMTVTGGVAVYIKANGQLGTLTSSRRFKNEINDMGTISDRLMQLRPVTFRYKDSAEKGPHPLQYGLIAEEVAQVFPDLVQYDRAGKPFTVYYHLLTPMLLNELQKEHRRSEGQKAEIASLKTALESQKAELAAMKQAQEQQFKALAKLSTFVQSAQHREPVQQATFVAHR